VIELAAVIGEREACLLLGFSRATLKRHHRSFVAVEPKPRKQTSFARKLSDQERQAIRDAFHSERFADLCAREVYAILLDEGVYLGSISAIYRVLREAGETKERRRLATHPTRVKPELAATAPLLVWSWDITKLPGPQKWIHYNLYVVLDVFSRYVVAWRLEARESAVLAEEMFTQAFVRENVDPKSLIVHADGGPAMTSRTLAQLFSDLGVAQSRSRPQVSNDNPFIESHFPSYPGHFANLEQAREFCRQFFDWYNHQHRHTGIALLAPADVHCGRVEQKRDARRAVLRAAHSVHPERFVRGLPEPPSIEKVVYINEPQTAEAA
jgi:putative transposase